ncbi:nitroreductase family protein [Kribbella sp. NBC_01505]|uniref:nitroreductase family protein n=1 Tax=Kribbella sp. NBC_01505 TaxID=2903580 RepID=UPI003867BD73
MSVSASVSVEGSYRLRYGGQVAGEPPAEWTEVLAQQLAHRSVRRYRPDDEVSEETLFALIAAAQSAPTSGNLQLWARCSSVPSATNRSRSPQSSACRPTCSRSSG